MPRKVWPSAWLSDSRCRWAPTRWSPQLGAPGDVRQRPGGVVVDPAGPLVGGEGLGRAPQVQPETGQTGVLLRDRDDQGLAVGVGSERPPNLGQPVPRRDHLRGEGQVAGDLGDGQLGDRVLVLVDGLGCAGDGFLAPASCGRLAAAYGAPGSAPWRAGGPGAAFDDRWPPDWPGGCGRRGLRRAGTGHRGGLGHRRVGRRRGQRGRRSGRCGRVPGRAARSWARCRRETVPETASRGRPSGVGGQGRVPPRLAAPDGGSSGEPVKPAAGGIGPIGVGARSTAGGADLRVVVVVGELWVEFGQVDGVPGAFVAGPGHRICSRTVTWRATRRGARSSTPDPARAPRQSVRAVRMTVRAGRSGST